MSKFLASVIAPTVQFQIEQDLKRINHFSDWIYQYMTTDDPNAHIKHSYAYMNYLRYCGRTEQQPLTETDFALSVQSHEIRVVPIDDTFGYKGLAIRN